jgi:hypothetical protein
VECTSTCDLLFGQERQKHVTLAKLGYPAALSARYRSSMHQAGLAERLVELVAVLDIMLAPLALPGKLLATIYNQEVRR